MSQLIPSFDLNFETTVFCDLKTDEAGTVRLAVNCRTSGLTRYGFDFNLEYHRLICWEGNYETDDSISAGVAGIDLRTAMAR